MRWKIKTRFLPIFLLISFALSLFSFTTPPAQATNTRRILRHSQEHYGWSASKFASLIDVYQGHIAAIRNGIVGQIKAIRPEVLGFIYRNSLHIWCNPNHDEFDGSELTLFRNNGWILRDINTNNYITAYSGDAYYIDFGNPNYHTWLANWYKDKVDTYGLDGATVDNWFANSDVWWYVDSGRAKNPRTGSAWTSQQICDAYKALTLKVRSVLGTGKLIHCNAVQTGWKFYQDIARYSDGILNGGFDVLLSEGWLTTNHDASVWMSETDWKKSIDFAVWLEDNWSIGKYFQPVCTDSSFQYGTSYPPDMTQAQYEQYVTYCYASRLLTAKNLNTIIEFGFYIDKTYPQSLFQIDIGDPAEDYHIVSGTHVYEREYTQGIVYVNPTSTSYNANSPSGHFHNAVTGADVSSLLTLGPHRGLVLLKASGSTPVPVPVPVPVPGDTSTIFSNGFESGGLSGWTATYASAGSAATVQSSVKYSEDYAVDSGLPATAGAYAVVVKTFASSYSTLFARAYVRFSALPTTGNYLLLNPTICDAGNHDLVAVYIHNDAGAYRWALRYETNTGSGRVYSSTPEPTINTWYCLEIQFVGASGNGEARLWVNGVERCTKTGLTNSNRLAQQVQVGACSRSALAVHVYTDSVVADIQYIGTETGVPISSVVAHSAREPVATRLEALEEAWE